jgi:hypothetical protein
LVELISNPDKDLYRFRANGPFLHESLPYPAFGKTVLMAILAALAISLTLWLLQRLAALM